MPRKKWVWAIYRELTNLTGREGSVAPNRGPGGRWEARGPQLRGNESSLMRPEGCASA